MVYVVMPGGKNSEISFRVKCVIVENERVFGDVVLTRQTEERLRRLNSDWPNINEQNACNLTKKLFETPDFMALNRKTVNRGKRNESTTKMKIAYKENRSNDKNSIDRGIINHQVVGQLERKPKSYPLPMLRESVSQEIMVTSLVDQLLLDIYGYPRSERGRSESDSTVSSQKPPPQHRYLRRARLLRKSKEELAVVLETLMEHVNHSGGLLVRQLRRRDYLMAKRDKHYDVITAHLQAYSAKRSEDTRMRFSLTPQPGESGFTQWLDAMKMVARLQGGIPQEFRKRLWLTLAERHLDQRGVDWKQAEKLCFNEWSNPDDEELGIQIVKDLHRTGCSLFCGAAGRDNQAVLRRVLLGFARWNKSVGYCQGLNVLAALILQVTDRGESSAVKVMIYLIEGVLPEGYFADNLRGLSIDMAVFRDLLRMRLPKLSRHLEALQTDAKDKATGSSYEPPLTNVFTMQWFLTLFCHCLPQDAVLRVWDLIFLEGDEVLLRTALAIWEGISDRIMTVTSADEFYSIMGVLTREMLEFTDVNHLIKTIVNMGPLYGVTDLREKHRYNITPWARRLSDEEDTDTEEEERLAVAAAMFGVPQRFKKDRSNASSSALQTIGPTNDRERLALDISTLKHQYAKLRERQRQAHIILSAACARQSLVPSTTSQAMNHLLVGKSALVSAKTRQLGPPPGAIPPKPRTTSTLHPPRVQSGRRDKQGVTLHWKDTKKPKDEQSVGDEADSSSSGMDNPSETMSTTQLTSPSRVSANDSDSDSTSTELCDEPDRLSDVDSEEPTSTSDCYVMATDDEKSPRPGASPIIGNTPIRQNSIKNATVKRDSAYLAVDDLDNAANVESRDFLSVEETSSSIARITDQIRRLSASDDNNSPPISRLESREETKNEVDDEVYRENDKSTSKTDNVLETNVDNSYSSSLANVEAEESASSQVSDAIFELLDRYDFSSSNDQSVIADKPMDAVSPNDKYRQISVQDTSIIGDNYAASCVETTNDLSRGHSMESLKTSPLESIAREKTSDEIIRFDAGSMSSESYGKSRLESSDLLVANFSKYEDPSEIKVSTIGGDESDRIISERTTFYSPSYVIGHLPISPATMTEKLSRAVDVLSLTDNGRSKDIGTFDVDGRKNDDTSFPSMANTLSESKLEDSSTLFTTSINDPANFNYQVHKGEESNSTPSKTTSMDTRVPDTLVSFDANLSSNDKIDDFDKNVEKIGNLIPEPETLDPVISDILSIGNGTNTKIGSLDYDSTPIIDRSVESLMSPLTEVKVGTCDTEKLATSPNLIVTDRSTLQLSSNYVFNDSLSTKIHEDKKKSPKTPESGKSFSSGETMGPDSKNSSITTSPTNRSDSQNLALDKSEHSSLSSESKTLTLRSIDSEVGANSRTRLDTRSDLTRPSLDKSSPSTPISTDSLKNKSEISPKFVISSSSESCSPGKTTKSSERSFSSELQSPVSANSIKYRANYTEEQDNLSGSSMDICSATSPFYPIPNPDQKTPSPYGTTIKSRTNGHSEEETSPEQKSTSSKDDKSATKFHAESSKADVTRSIEVGKSLRSSDDYDSAKPFEKELAETLSTLPCDRTKNERITSLYKEDHVGSSYRTKKPTIEEVKEIDERYSETDTVSPLPRDKYDGNRSVFVDKTLKNLGINEHKYSLGTRETLKPFERSCSSLEKRFGDSKASPSSDEFIINTHKKRSSDILEDLKHLEAKTTKDGNADTSMLTRKTGYDWEDLKNLEARRQDNFSDSASKFSRVLLDPPRISVFNETRKSYVVEPKINLEEGSDSILKSYARKKSNGEPDDDRESKLGVWTKVKPRMGGRDSGRRSSDRALKIIQENSAILHKILTCQAKKRLPDLEEISKEITISPINEEISKIFSPILEKMGLNEHEINEELARINFKDFDQMTTTSGSEFDAKMNDELSKLSLIDDNEIVDQMDIEDVISRNYLDTREALIDRQINEELSKLLANYEDDSPRCASSNHEEASSCQNPSEIEGIDMSSISTNVFSYKSSNDSIDMKSELDPIQEPTIMGAEKFSQFSDVAMMKYGKSPKYSIRGMSPRSDIDIYRELEKLDKISSGEILPSSSSSIVSQKIISPIVYADECPMYAEVRPTTLEYSSKSDKSYERSPMKSPYDTYKPYDFKSRISPRKTPSNPYSARSYEKSGMEKNFDFHEDPTTPSRLYDVGTSRPIMSKETLEFRVRYDDETSKIMRNDDLTLEPYQTSLPDLERGASYYTNESSASLKRLETEMSHDQQMVSPLDCSYNQSNLYTRKYESPKNYLHAKNKNDYEKHETYKYDESIDEAGSYLSFGRKNSHSLSPNYQYDDYGSTMNPYSAELSCSHEDPSKGSLTHPPFADNLSHVVNYGLDTETRESLNFRKASLSLGPLETTTSRINTIVDATNSPKSMFSPFPIRNTSRKPKELGLKLGLYSPSSPGSNPLKRS